MRRVSFIQNKQTLERDNSKFGGGGLYLDKMVNVNLLESIFLENEAYKDHGHQIHSEIREYKSRVYTSLDAFIY